MNKIILATGNRDKADEIKRILDNKFEVVTMKEIDIDVDIIENGETFEDNALIKVRALKPLVDICDSDCIIMADDSGLSVEALDGAPGIFSARYAGEDVSYDENNKKLLEEMKDVPENERSAEFVCVVAVVYPDGQEQTFRGSVRGKIAFDFTGEGGFGYDPLFIVDETGKSYAQMTSEEKNKISHRAEAVAKAKIALEKYQQV